MSKRLIKKARMYAAGSQVGIPIEAGKYVTKKLTCAYVNHFLDFLQFSGVMKDVTSGTRTVKLTSGRKKIMPEVMRTLHKSEMVRQYIAVSEEKSYTTANGKPSVPTIQNMLNNCPASQHKSLSGLDNVAAEGSDSVTWLLKLTGELKKIAMQTLVVTL